MLRKMGYLIGISPQYLMTIPDLTIVRVHQTKHHAEFWDLQITFLRLESSEIFSCISYTF